MSHAITCHNSVAVKRLISEGIIPPLCKSFTLVVDPKAAIVMKMEVFVTGEQMDAIVNALADCPEEAKRIAREIIFSEPRTGRKAKVEL